MTSPLSTSDPRTLSDAARDAERRPLLKWGLVFGFWVFFGFLNASQFFLGARSEGMSHPFGRMLAWQLLGWLPWAFLTPVVLWLGRRLPLERASLARTLPLHLLACALAASAHIAIFTYLTILLTPFGPLVPARAFMSMFYGRLTSQFHLELLIYGATLGVLYAFSYYDRYREREVRSRALEARLAQAELQALKMQLHPHFLFNTLNGIAGLVRDSRNKAAVEMIVGLSDLLRYTLETAGRQEVPLREELEFLELYLGIQQMRFSDRLRVELSVAPDTLDAMVPNLILQPLVENAIRHGVSQRASAGTVGVAASREGARLRITVYDDGPGLRRPAAAETGGGIGLANTRARLEQLYGGGQSFDVASREAGGVEARLSIPFRDGRGHIAEA